MPKHALTFKHLLGSVSVQRQGGGSGSNSASVNDLLDRSRAASASTPGYTPTSKETPPHLVWSPASGSGPDSVGVHPAELLRREQLAHASAARRVAGPAPPRSWRPAHGESRTRATNPDVVVTVDELSAAGAFLLGERKGTHAYLRKGPPSLVDTCLGLVLALLRDETVVWDGEEEDDDAERVAPVTMREAALAGACELDLHLRAGLLRASALLPPDSGSRLSDGDIRALLEYEPPAHSKSPHLDTAVVAVYPHREEAHEVHGRGEEGGEEGEEWEWAEDSRPTLSHLALTCHPAPLRMLRDVPRLSALALTSLDLAFATLPPLERVVAALPPGLRVLGLSGVRAKSYDGWERGLGALARKMIVLQMLDISHSPLGAAVTVRALLPVGKVGHLPSLRVLGVRGHLPGEMGGTEEERAADKQTRRKVLRAAVLEGAGRWVDVRFE